MFASIIICTRNRCAALKETLRALDTVNVPAGRTVEVLVVDNGSSDGTQALLQATHLAKFELRSVIEPTAGKSLACNTATRNARGDILVWIDDDVRPHPNWLEEITKPIAEGRFDAVCGKVVIPPHLQRPWMTLQHLGWLACTDSIDPEAPRYAVGANMAFAKKILERVPEYDPELGPPGLGFYEDVLFTSQIKHAGYRLGMATKAIVEHHFDAARLSRESFLKRAVGEGRSLAYVTWHWKHERNSFPLLRSLKHKLMLQLNRFRRRKECGPEGLPLWELNLLVAASFHEQMSKERRRQRVYERYGGRKLNVRENASV